MTDGRSGTGQELFLDLVVGTEGTWNWHTTRGAYYKDRVRFQRVEHSSAAGRSRPDNNKGRAKRTSTYYDTHYKDRCLDWLVDGEDLLSWGRFLARARKELMIKKRGKEVSAYKFGRRVASSSRSGTKPPVNLGVEKL